ncbi:hypothetical protein [Hymenobacter agri]
MLNAFVIALLQAASFLSTAPASQPVSCASATSHIQVDGGSSGWGGDIAMDGGSSGWGGDIAVDGGSSGWGGDIAVDGGSSGWGGDIA